jgi:predicted DNA binding CopG/RHH family protein
MGVTDSYALVNLRLRESLYETVKQLAAARDIPAQQWIREAIREKAERDAA